MASLVDLLVDICQRNGIKALKWKNDKTLVGKIGEQNMALHRWFATKACPGDFLVSKHAWITEQVNARLQGQELEPQPTEEYYVVQKGDTMTKIAIMFNTSLPELKRLNPQIKNISLIYVGQKVRVK
jgi:LysM repeat protein